MGAYCSLFGDTGNFQGGSTDISFMVENQCWHGQKWYNGLLIDLLFSGESGQNWEGEKTNNRVLGQGAMIASVASALGWQNLVKKWLSW